MREKADMEANMVTGDELIAMMDEIVGNEPTSKKVRGVLRNDVFELSFESAYLRVVRHAKPEPIYSLLIMGLTHDARIHPSNYGYFELIEDDEND